MAYFSIFPTIEYDIQKAETDITLTDILRGASVRAELKQNLAFYIRYEYKDTDRPEIISYKLYDSPSLHWLVLQMNDVVDPYYDLPVSERGLINYVESKYPGQTFFLNSISLTSSSSSSGGDGFIELADGGFTTDEYVYAQNDSTTSGNITGGDFIGTNRIKLESTASSEDDAYKGAVVKLDDGVGEQFTVITAYNGTTKWAELQDAITLTSVGCGTSTYELYPSGTVHRWDATFSRLEVDNIYGTFDEGDQLVGLSSGKEALLQRKVAQSKSAVHHFEDVTTGEWLDPRGTDVNYIAGYIMGEDNSVIEGAVITNEVYERTENDNKRFVNLIDPDVVSLAVSDFSREINL